MCVNIGFSDKLQQLKAMLNIGHVTVVEQATPAEKIDTEQSHFPSLFFFHLSLEILFTKIVLNITPYHHSPDIFFLPPAVTLLNNLCKCFGDTGTSDNALASVSLRRIQFI